MVNPTLYFTNSCKDCVHFSIKDKVTMEGNARITEAAEDCALGTPYLVVSNLIISDDCEDRHCKRQKKVSK